MIPVYYEGSDLADLSVVWLDTAGVLIDFSDPGYTFEVKIAPFGTTVASFTKASNISGHATPPNITVAWNTVGELNTLPAGHYIIQIKASIAGKDRFMQERFEVLPALT